MPSQNRSMSADRDPGGRSGPTGRILVTFQPGTSQRAMRALQDVAGLTAASTADFADAMATDAQHGADALLLEHLDIAVVDADPDQVAALTTAVATVGNPIYFVEPEVWMHAIGVDDSYVRGFAAGVQALANRVLGGPDGALLEPAAVADFADTAELTWGLQAIQAHRSQATGAGMRIAVLDTGMDLSHPDFLGRSLLSASFVPGETVRDVVGHGTHCIGTACGTSIAGQRRYGVSGESMILVGKVLGDTGSGKSAWILNGINWAIHNRATVISMSLGSAVAPGQGYSPAYEQAAKSALAANAIIVAAAGNAGNSPVGNPANCPSVLSVAAIDKGLRRASFSCIGINPSGGEVNLAAPGVDVFSTAPMAERYQTLRGTSMATPHVAGCAALWAQATGLRGIALWQKLMATTRNIDQTIQHVGAGLVQAPS